MAFELFVVLKRPSRVHHLNPRGLHLSRTHHHRPTFFFDFAGLALSGAYQFQFKMEESAFFSASGTLTLLPRLDTERQADPQFFVSSAWRTRSALSSAQVRYSCFSGAAQTDAAAFCIS